MSSDRLQGDVGLADAALAMSRLAADEAGSEQIAALLGLTLTPRTAATPVGQFATAPTPVDDYELEISRTIRAEQPRGPRSDPVEREVPQLTSQTPWRRYLQPVGRQLAPATSGHQQPLAPDPLVRRQLPFEPLFAPRLTPALVVAAAATDAGSGDLDVEGLVESLSTRRPIRTLPRLPYRSLLRGVQVLADVGSSMSPFERDRTRLLDAIRAGVGADLVQQLAFSSSPTRAGSGPSWTWRSYEAPPPGTPVLALTDLGIPGLGRAEPVAPDWIALQLQLARRGSALVVLVPFPPHRWPDELRGRLRLIQWDRTATPSSLLRALARGRK